MTQPHKYLPGSSWAYFKIYGGIRSLEEWMISHFVQQLAVWQHAGSFQHWFFIRFWDPEYHLRIRFQLEPDQLGDVIRDMHDLLQKMADNELVWKCELATYEPEIERYGLDRIGLVEHFFEQDSYYWINEFSRISLDAANESWRSALIHADSILNTFDLSVEEKKQTIDRLQNAGGHNFGHLPSLKKQLKGKYSRLQGDIKQIMLADRTSHDHTVDFLRETSSISRGLAGTFPNREELNSSPLIPDLLHMSMNRAFCAKTRLQEFVIYDFLNRYYGSNLA